jgi:hypothetical protein
MAKYTDNNELFTFLDHFKDAYEDPIEIIDGLEVCQKDIVKTIEYYTSGRYLGGNSDGLGRDKPFYEINNFRVRVAKTATDIDIKDIKAEADKPKFFVQAMLLNSELYKWMKEADFSKTLNEMGHTRPKYGGLLVKKTEDDDLDISVVAWKNAITDQVDILSFVIEEHHLSPSKFMKMKEWDNKEEVMEAFKKNNKSRIAGRKIKILEFKGELPKNFIEDVEEDDYAPYKGFVAEVGNKKYKLWSKETEKENYKYLEWEKVPGRGLGRGIVEEGFEAQIWTNDSIIAMKDAMQLGSKVMLSTNSQKITDGTNIITDVDNGHIYKMEANATIAPLNLVPSAMPHLINNINLWKDQYDRVASTFDANTGEAPTSGTPLGTTQLLNSVANSPFEYQREVWGIFLNEIINDWVFPHLIKKLRKGHILVSDFDEEELKMIDDSFAVFNVNKKFVDRILGGEDVYMDEYVQTIEAYKSMQGALGRRRYIEIPDGFFDDFEGKITINITGELRNKQAVLQSLNTILLTVAQNPAILADPTLFKVFGTIVELSGVPISPVQLKPSAPIQQAPQQGVPSPLEANQIQNEPAPTI